MSLQDNNEYINKNIYPISTSKKEIILSLITEISKSNEKLAQIKASSNQGKVMDYKNEIENMKQQKEKINKEINSLSMDLLLNLSNKNNLIKKKQYSIKEISKKINNYKKILLTYENIAFNSSVLKKYLMVNNYNALLSDEQIDDILSKTQNITKNDNLIQKTEKEFLEKKEELKNVEQEKRKILNKLNEIKENIKMLKEEKIVVNNELVNYISLKETLDSIIKTHLISLLSNIDMNNNEDIKEDINLEKDVFLNNREKYSRNRINKIINNIHEENDNNEFSYLNNNSNNFGNLKIWKEIFNLTKYELYNLDSNKLSNEICNDIFDLINARLNTKYIDNNMGKSISLEKNQSITMLGKGKSHNINDRYSSFNPQTFSYESPIIKRTKSNILISNTHILSEYKNDIQNRLKNEIKDLIININENKISPNNSNEFLSNVLINILYEKGYKLNKTNLMIYISCLLKKSFYEYQISSKIKFINKDYKNIKKLKKKIYDKLQDQLTKLNSKIESINNTIILQENKLKLLINNTENKKNKVDKVDIINMNGNINLNLEEQNYIQLCRKANSFINEKNEIEKEIEMIENDKKLEQYQGELKITNLKNELNDLNKQIISKENELSENKRKLEEKIAQITKEIDVKYNLIKENLILLKTESLNNNNQTEYNEFIEKINNNIQNDYYKIIFNLEKFYTKNKKPEINTSIENFTNNENILKTSKSFNFNSYRNNNKNMKLFSYGNNFFSPNNNKNVNLKLYNINKLTRKINNDHWSNKNHINQKNVKNNYIDIFDSYNNLNNYFFQFHAPSTQINFDKQNHRKKTNNLNNQEKSGNDRTNNITNSSPFSSGSKYSSSKKKNLSPSNNNDIKPKNLIYNLRYLSSDKKYDQNINKMNNINEYKLIQNNTINIYKSDIDNISKNNKNMKENNFFQSFSLNKHKSKRKTHFLYKSNPDIKFEQINILNQKIFCYFRLIKKDKKEKEYNSILDDLSLLNFGNSPYNFIKSTIYIDKHYKKIKIFPSNQLEPIEIKSDKIENYIIHPNIKKIISIYNDYQTFKEKNNNKDDIKLFIQKMRKNKSYNDMNDEDIKKCCFNQKFSFELILKNGINMGILLNSYEDFKNMTDNICTLIKDKKETLYELFNINKFEYPK